MQLWAENRSLLINILVLQKWGIKERENSVRAVSGYDLRLQTFDKNVTPVYG